MSAFVPAAHAVDGCMATVTIVDDAGHTVTENTVPCTGGMQNGHSYVYDQHGHFVAEISNGGYGDPPLVPLSGGGGSAGGSTGSSHSSSSSSSSGSGHTTSHPKPPKPGKARSQSSSTATR
jgi:hypothetical protein